MSGALVINQSLTLRLRASGPCVQDCDQPLAEAHIAAVQCSHRGISCGGHKHQGMPHCHPGPYLSCGCLWHAGQTQTICLSRHVNTRLMKLQPQQGTGEET